ncbi:hypothetical protein EHQ96_12990 [Leptospira levettii]|uniref:Uncharacterized protein n=1 Tax=Leptospira levettii TaxID=2023178 RepID=A0A5F2AFG1_9LEPT|nr:hypothetical protein [Leptospira levettii]MCG6149909.1 hypothetical protein [Leptospira levettii]MCW7466766.1 hypothetical protein [Leptospira levettii]MCW7512489.1 hypothetical protein [Leptospira levettii]MCW7515923.1 hypothetical protein [Leptospira levettii]TGL69574.1 hypothetical protein EHQ60_12010 [Leptospira levettii]
MKNLIQITVFSAFLAIQPIAAHGEHKPGPNGGVIRMPGAFHTEVLAYQNLGFKVYLLDINFENPTSKNSNVSASIVNAGKEVSLKCTGHPDHFYCELPKGVTLTEGELRLSPVWKGQKGAEVKYKLPLNEMKEEKKEHHHG